MTLKRKLINKAANGDYGFSKEYILNDKRLLDANMYNYYDCLLATIIWYADWQLHIIKDYYYNNTGMVMGLCKNIEKQIAALEAFRNDWRIACYLDEL